MRAAAIAIGISAWASVAHAHGPSGSHESPAWCGDHLAMLADGGVVVDGVPLAVAVGEGLVAWSPACDRLAVAGERIWIVDAVTGAVRDLGRLPGGFERAMRMEGPAPSIRWSPSGARFAVVVVSETIDHMSLARVDVKGGTVEVLPVAGEIVAFALADDETAVVAVRPPRAPHLRLERVTRAAATPINATGYAEARISVAPLVVGAVTTKDELVIVHAASGAERPLVAKVDYLQAMSADGSHALAVIGSRASTVDGAGRVSPFDGDLVYGYVADEHTGWSVDGTRTIARAAHGWVISAAGAKARVWKLPKGDVEHVSVAPDGKRAAFVLETPLAAPPGARRCDYDAWTRADLYVAGLGAAPRARKVVALARLHACGVE